MATMIGTVSAERSAGYIQRQKAISAMNWANVSVTRNLLTRFPDLEMAGYKATRVVLSPDLEGEVVANATTTIAQAHRAVLYIHGGAYCYLNPKAFRLIVGRILSVLDHDDEKKKKEEEGGWVALLPDYSLAPEKPFPAGLRDCLMGYKYLLNVMKMKADDIHLAGDSAGGGLTLALLCLIREESLPLPGSVTVISPWCDLTEIPRSFEANKDSDIFGPNGKDTWTKCSKYYAGEKLDDPLVSPTRSNNFKAMKNVRFLIQAAEREQLLSNSIDLHHKLCTDGVDRVQLSIYQHMNHDFQLLPDPVCPESTVAIQEIANHIRGVPSQHSKDRSQSQSQSRSKI